MANHETYTYPTNNANKVASEEKKQKEIDFYLRQFQDNAF